MDDIALIHESMDEIDELTARMKVAFDNIENTLSEARESITAMQEDLRALLDNPPTHD